MFDLLTRDGGVEHSCVQRTSALAKTSKIRGWHLQVSVTTADWRAVVFTYTMPPPKGHVPLEPDPAPRVAALPAPWTPSSGTWLIQSSRRGKTPFELAAVHDGRRQRPVRAARASSQEAVGLGVCGLGAACTVQFGYARGPPTGPWHHAMQSDHNSLAGALPGEIPLRDQWPMQDARLLLLLNMDGGACLEHCPQQHDGHPSVHQLHRQPHCRRGDVADGMPFVCDRNQRGARPAAAADRANTRFLQSAELAAAARSGPQVAAPAIEADARSRWASRRPTRSRPRSYVWVCVSGDDLRVRPGARQVGQRGGMGELRA